MATSDRKKKILAHLAKSGNGMNYDLAKKRIVPQPLEIPQAIDPIATPVAPQQPEEVIPPPPITKPETSLVARQKLPKFSFSDRKRRIMDHVNNSSGGNFGNFSLDSPKRKQQIREHLRKSQS